MSFDNRFLEIIDVLDARYRRSAAIKPNSADIGELSETFIRDALAEIVEGSARAYRGGKIIDSSGHQSKQMDVVVTSRHALKIYADKGLYPVESVIGAFAITTHLTLNKLLGDIGGLASIPVSKPAFSVQMPGLDQHLPQILKHWPTVSPYRCVFAFSGVIKRQWITSLNNLVRKKRVSIDAMPSLIVVNRVGAIHKIGPLQAAHGVHPSIAGKNDLFGFTPFTTEQHVISPLKLILNALNTLSHWQFHLSPNYSVYF